jgi:hypothetical protein
MYHFVFCDICHGRHHTKWIKILNVEEDFFGRDCVTFKCPDDETDRTTKSSVYANGGMNDEL